MSKLHVRTGDTVKIITGPEKGAKGKVLSALPDKGRVVVEGVNIAIHHKKPRNTQEQGGRVEIPAPLHASNVQLVCPKCNKATRVGHRIENGKKLRVCKKCGAAIE